VREPTPRWRLPVLVSIPHYGTRALPGIRDEDFAEPGFRRFPRGYADAFAADLYGDLHTAGATVLASPYSRLFVDLNRHRSDYDVAHGAVRSRRGVVRTHIVDARPIFARPVTPAELERRLAQYYDPYHEALDRLSAEMLSRHGSGLVLDAHTGSEKGMGPHQIVIGTRRGATANPALRDTVAAVFRGHGFDVHHDIPGYAGAHIVRRIGIAGPRALHAVQIEVNTALLMTTARREYFASIDRGESPRSDPLTTARLRACMREVVHRASEKLSENERSGPA
jgi:N-formylglutamate amidohydrolase